MGGDDDPPCKQLLTPYRYCCIQRSSDNPLLKYANTESLPIPLTGSLLFKSTLRAVTSSLQNSKNKIM